jgi:uncharacterized protein YbjQ (UPF0145 family)
MEILIQIVVPLASVVVLLMLGFTIGRTRERRHFADLEHREATNSKFLVTNLKTVPPGMQPQTATLVLGATVIASDYLKKFLSGFRMIFGGEMKSYSSMIERARREARLRMIESARAAGAMAVINIRFETSNVSGTTGRNAAPMSEVLCYGTALLPSGH